MERWKSIRGYDCYCGSRSDLDQVISLLANNLEKESRTIHKQANYAKVSFKILFHSLIKGTWKNNKLEGIGKRIFANGDVYEGNFSRHEADGQGVLTKKDGTLCTGSWKHSKLNGEGVIKFLSGDSYQGNFLDNKKSEFGKYVYSNSGIVIQGQWENDLPIRKIRALNSFTFFLGIPEKLSLVQPTILAEGQDNPPIIEAGEKLTLKIDVKTSTGETVKEETGRIITFIFQFVSSNISSNTKNSILYQFFRSQSTSCSEETTTQTLFKSTNNKYKHS